MALDKDNSVTINCKTNYPFELRFLYRINAEQPFDFFIRVPELYITEESSIQINEDDVHNLSPDPHTGMHKTTIKAGRTAITYKLGARIRIEKRANDTVAIHHGSLLYALEIGAKITSRHPRDWEYQLPLPAETTVPETRDYVITNTTAWAIAIDPSTLKFHHSNPANSIKPLPSPIFQAGAPPTFITAQGCEIDWGYWKDVPADPPLPEMRKCKGKPFQVNLIPYGAAKIHMAQFPTVDLSECLDLVRMPSETEQRSLGTSWEGGYGSQTELKNGLRSTSRPYNRLENHRDEL